MPVPEPINVAIIGAGGIAAKLHLPQLEEIPGVQIKILAGRKRERLEVLSKRHGGRIVTDYRAAIEDPGVNAVVISTPHPQHVAWGVLALQAGKHVFMQKPLAPSIAEADRFVAAVEQSDRSVYCLPQLTTPAILMMQELLAEGKLGQLSGGHCRFSHGGPEVYNAGVRELLGEAPLKAGEKLWFFEAGEAAVGALFDMGVYAIARLVGVLGEARRVMGMTAILHKPSQVEDTASLLIQFANGAITTAETGWCDGASTGRLMLHGTEGRVEMFGYSSNTITLYQQASKTNEDLAPIRTEIDCSKYPALNSHRQWVELIRAHAQPKLETAQAARHITEIMLAGLESGRTGRVVELKTGL